MVEDLKKVQPEVNILDQKKWCYSEAEGSHQTLEIIRLRRPCLTWKTSRLKRSWVIQTPCQICRLL